MAENLVLIPKEVYVGDVAEVRFSFSSDVDITPTTIDSMEALNQIFKTQNDSITIRSLQIYNDEKTNEVVLSLQIIPWKPGVLQMPSIEAGRLPNNEMLETIEIPSVTILSILDKTAETTVQDVIPPSVIPGTTYVVYGVLIFTIVFLILIGTVLFRLESVKNFFTSLLFKKLHSRNFRAAKKKIAELRKSVDEISCEVFAMKYQQIVRGYFEGHYKILFSTATSNEIKSIFESLDFNDKGKKVSKEVIKNLTMTDEIRFSDTKKKSFKIETKLNMLESLEEILVFFECGNEKKPEELEKENVTV